MRQKLTNTELGRTGTFVCLLLAFPLCVPASDTTHIAFTSERNGNAGNLHYGYKREKSAEPNKPSGT